MGLFKTDVDFLVGTGDNGGLDDPESPLTLAPTEDRGGVWTREFKAAEDFRRKISFNFAASSLFMTVISPFNEFFDVKENGYKAVENRLYKQASHYAILLDHNKSNLI